MATLLLAERNGNQLSDHTARALSAALALRSEVHVLVTGRQIADICQQVAALNGVAKVLGCEAPALADELPEPLADLIVSMAPTYSAIVAAATSTAKSVMPRVAALLDVMQVSEAVEILGPDKFKRPIFASNAFMTVQSTDPIKVVTVRTPRFAAAPVSGSTAPIETLFWSGNNSLSTHISVSGKSSDQPDLAGARIVVSGGRAFGSKEKFDEYLVPLAAKLGGAIGASRAAVDAGYAANELQVGQTGKIVAPDLYIACGISGAIQHLAGIKDAKVIVAINKDGDAPIFQFADYGLVGDVFDLLPELVRSL